MLDDRLFPLDLLFNFSDYPIILDPGSVLLIVVKIVLIFQVPAKEFEQQQLFLRIGQFLLEIQFGRGLEFVDQLLTGSGLGDKR
mgnify:FL=1